MRMLMCSAAVIASFCLTISASANGPGEYGGDFAGGEDCMCDPCDPCACGHQGIFGHHRNRRNAELGFNCGCNGSYKYPVPPLYTYHWPGMYSAQLMTDYHSPWRFPPLKPYTDEVPIEVQSSNKSLRRVQPAAALLKVPASNPSSFADHVESTFR